MDREEMLRDLHANDQKTRELNDTLGDILGRIKSEELSSEDGNQMIQDVQMTLSDLKTERDALMAELG